MEPDADCEMKTTEHETQLLKMLFELAFSVIMVIVGQLREEQTAVVEQRRNYCFLCGIDKRRFELEAVQASKKDGGGWIEHIRNEHNVWDYFFLLLLLAGEDQARLFGRRHLRQQLPAEWRPRLAAREQVHL